MPKVTAETTVSFPKDYVYDLFTNPEVLPQIMPKFIKSCKVVGKKDGADLVSLQLNIPEAHKGTVEKLVGKGDSITAKVTNTTGESVSIERTDGLFEKFNIRLTFNSLAADKTKVNADIEFDAGGWGVANKGLLAAFNTFAPGYLADADAKIQEAIRKGDLKLPPPRGAQPPPPAA